MFGDEYGLTDVEDRLDELRDDKRDLKVEHSSKLIVNRSILEPIMCSVVTLKSLCNS